MQLPIYALKRKVRSSLVPQWVKDPASVTQLFGSPLWQGFDPRPRNFLACQGHGKKGKKKITTRKREKKGNAVSGSIPDFLNQNLHFNKIPS